MRLSLKLAQLPSLSSLPASRTHYPLRPKPKHQRPRPPYHLKVPEAPPGDDLVWLVSSHSAFYTLPKSLTRSAIFENVKQQTNTLVNEVRETVQGQPVASGLKPSISR